jgi:hypothetical protein
MTTQIVKCPKGEFVLVTDRYQILPAGGRMANKMKLRTLDCTQSDGEKYQVGDRPPWLCESCKFYGKIRSLP